MGETSSASDGTTAGASTAAADQLDEFVASGRTGRRNAVADIADDPNGGTGTAGLVDKFCHMATTSTDAQSGDDNSTKASSSVGENSGNVGKS